MGISVAVKWKIFFQCRQQKSSVKVPTKNKLCTMLEINLACFLVEELLFGSDGNVLVFRIKTYLSHRVRHATPTNPKNYLNLSPVEC